MVLPCTTVAKILVHGWIATAVIMGIVFVSSHAAAPPLRRRFARLPLLRALSRGLSQRAAFADPEQRHAYTYKCAAPRPRRRRLGFTPGRRGQRRERRADRALRLRRTVPEPKRGLVATQTAARAAAAQSPTGWAASATTLFRTRAPQPPAHR